MKLDKMTKQKIDEFFDSKTPEELEYLWKKYDKYSEENLTIPVVSRSKPNKEETKNHIKYIAEYTKAINKMRLKDLDIHLDYGQTTEDKTLS